MKKSILTLLILCSSALLLAQQAPQYSHYVFNQFQLNPAVAGSKPCLDLRFGFRNQWAGFQDAPKTQFGSVTSRIGKPKKSSNTWHGIGLKFETDQAGAFSQSLVQLAYAYHFKLNRDMSASIGLFAGFNQHKIDFTQLVQLVPNGTASDPVLSDGQSSNLLFPEISPGFWMHNDNFFFGASIKHATGNNLRDSLESKLVQHINLTSGNAFALGAKTLFIPSIRISAVPGAPLAIDLNTMVDFNQKLALGVGYRNGDAMVAMMKFNFLNYFTLGYAYDVTTSPIRHLSNNTHEVILAITACPGKTTGRYNPCAAYD